MPPPAFHPQSQTVTDSSNSNDSSDSEHEDNLQHDPSLQLRTVRTAASAVAESIREEARVRRKKTKRRLRLFRSRGKEKRKASDSLVDGGEHADEEEGKRNVVKTPRRNVYVNMAPTPEERDTGGEPLVRYVRNKVKTTKYTIITFLPKNLYEQFRRVANLYFLALVVIQIFPIFGAAAPQISMLPLVFILGVTAIKDGVEDYRRSTLDDEVNNSAATKLGDWRNVNQPTDPRNWLEKLLGINKPGKVSKGVRKLRAREIEDVTKPQLSMQHSEDDAYTEVGDEAWEEMTATGHDTQNIVHTQKGDWPSESSVTLAASSAPNSKVDLTETPTTYPPVPVPPLPSHLRGQNNSNATSFPVPRGGDNEFGKRGHSTSDSQTASMRSSTTVVGSGSASGSNTHNTPPRPSTAPSRGRSESASGGVINWSARALGTARWERTLWKKLEVGDVVLLRESDQVPADIVVLSTSEPDGLCYLETKNLDGETNLKPRKALRATRGLRGEEDVERARFILDSEGPSANLYAYSGVLRYQEGTNGKEKAEPVGPNELLLRGTTLRNTNWVIGLVLYTGADTKIMLNGGATPSKRSKIERETNFNVVMNFIVLILMCLGSAIGSGVIGGEDDTSAHFFEAGSEPSSSQVVNAIVTFASCLIAFQNIVPISLYISIEIVKTIQAYFISQDLDMFYEALNAGCTPKTWNISDDLGQIEYIFSDKTGTLTQNVMELQRISAGGVKYGEGVTEAMRGKAKANGGGEEAQDMQDERIVRAKKEMLEIMDRAFTNRWAQPDQLTLVSPQLARDLADASSPQHVPLVDFFRALAVCHSVLPDRPPPPPQAMPDSSTNLASAKKKGTGGNFVVNYKAESPDEAALVAGARDIGFPFVTTSSNAITIEVLGRAERFTPLKTLEFTSARKRMSVVVRDISGRIILYTKGADSVVYARLRQLPEKPENDSEEDSRERDIRERTTRDMEDFANGGLRTLCIAYRYLSAQEYEQWAQIYNSATTSLVDREVKIDAAMDALEVGLNVLGATALEDKLQEGVPQAIETLHEAGIKLWILTGDKVQTAIEIGYSCNLLKIGMDVMVLAATSKSEARSKIEAGLNKVVKARGNELQEKGGFMSLGSRFEGGEKGGDGGFAVVIDGETLRYALEEDLKSLFLNLTTRCETVVCCRVSPAQKALTVRLVKEGRNALTLSIGDGANDVAMIQEANVGCGLLGLEGSQAAMSADYAFGQFRFLTKLLVVHGRWSYLRIANMHKNFFYKNVIWTLAMFWYLFYNSFDATYLYEYTFILLYNVVFTSLPVISLGAFDRDIDARAALAFPRLYERGIKGLDYTRTKFWLYMADGLYQSVIVFFIPFFAWGGGGVGGVGGGGGVEGGGVGGGAVSWNGKGIDSLADFGTTVAVAAIITANFYVGLNTYYWTFITWIVVVGSSLVMIIWIAIYSAFNSVDFNDEVVVLYGSVTFWATVLLTVIISLGPRFLVRFVGSSFFPLDRDIVREMWVLGDLKRELGIARSGRSRKASTSVKDGASKTEMAPIRKYHDRSASEATVNIGFNDEYGPGLSSSGSGGSGKGYDYEQTFVRSPGDFPVRLPPTVGVGYLDTPPESSGTATAVDSRGSGSTAYMAHDFAHPKDQDQQSIAWKWKTDSAMSLQYVVDGEPDPTAHHTFPPGAHRSPPQSGRQLPMSPSPNPSYYSVSDIPAPSPPPEPQYVTLDGSSLSATWSHSQRNAMRESPDQTPTPTSTHFLQESYNAPHDPSTDTNAIEMRVRSPPSSFPRAMRGTGANPQLAPRSVARSRSQESVSASNQGHGRPGQLRADSRASTVSRYATASEGGETEDGEDQERYNDQQAYYAQRPGSTQSLTPRAL